MTLILKGIARVADTCRVMLSFLVYLTLLGFAVPLACVGYVETRRGDPSSGVLLGAGALALVLIAAAIGIPPDPVAQ